jgi:galactoside 2-L-fucosyltransferase 1/2
MALLANCDHVIMTVGQFGWWGGWLANDSPTIPRSLDGHMARHQLSTYLLINGTTIYYSRSPRAGNRLGNKSNRDDCFPPSWIGIDAYDSCSSAVGDSTSLPELVVHKSMEYLGDLLECVQ